LDIYPVSRSSDEQFELGTVFAALPDPTRRSIVTMLAASDATVLELADPLEMSHPAISRHLKVLERENLITRSRVGRHRPCRLEPAALAEVATWATLTRKAWEDRLDRLVGFPCREAATTEPERTGRPWTT
jgi:DNA-binding transcriptional ArsR family regulator